MRLDVVKYKSFEVMIWIIMQPQDQSHHLAPLRQERNLDMFHFAIPRHHICYFKYYVSKEVKIQTTGDKELISWLHTD